MTREEAIQVLQEKIDNSPLFKDEREAYDMAIEALSTDVVQGEWIYNPKDAIELMFTKPKCSECGFESSDVGNFCSNCGAKMKGNNHDKRRSNSNT